MTVRIGSGAAAKTGAFLIDLASTSSWIDLSAFPTAPTGTCGSSSCTYADFDYFGAWGSVTLSTADFSSFQGPPRQAGILGTDFLSLNPTTLDYRGHRVFSATASTFCTPTELTAAGFGAVPSTGFYSTSLSSLLPLSTVITDGGVAGIKVPNVPTVRLRVAGVEALAQLDTGFDDAVVPRSININSAYLSALNTQAPGALTRAPTLDLTLTTCVGSAEPVTAWRVSAGYAVEFLGSNGVTVRAFADAVLFAKNTPPAARACGGIGTWSVPAAQVAGSFFVTSGAVVFDPVQSTVWLAR